MAITPNHSEEKLKDLNTRDTYSMILFILYKLHDIPEYSTLSELSYVLDNENMVNLLDYFGGMTITIPTKSEMRVVVDTLLVYQYVVNEKLSYKEAIRIVNPEAVIKVQECYEVVSKILSKYDFARGDN